MMRTLSVFFLISCAVSSVFVADAKGESWVENIKNKIAKKDVSAQQKSDKIVIEPAPSTAKNESTVNKKNKDMTKDELIAKIVNILKRDESILETVPGLGKSKDPEGNEIYTYKGLKFSDFDREELSKILGRIHNQALMKRTENINRQLEMISRTQSQPFRVPQAPPAVRTVPSVPSVPSVPRTAQPPSAPPTPPTRR